MAYRHGKEPVGFLPPVSDPSFCGGFDEFSEAAKVSEVPDPAVKSGHVAEADDLDAPYADDACWDVFLADEDECDPLPERGDFWSEDSETDE